jgi:hypothetical protein
MRCSSELRGDTPPGDPHPFIFFYYEKNNRKQRRDIMYNIRYLAVLSVLICFLATPVHAAQMSVEPAYQQVFNGDEITVNITVDPEESGIYGASYTLHFNTTLLYATSQTKGPFLTQDGADSDVWCNEIYNTAGRIEYAESRKGTWDEVTDPGVLATITFEVIGEEGTSTLNLSKYANELLVSTSGSVPTDTNNGSVEVRKGICGDVNDDGDVNMADVMTLWYDYANYPTPGAHEVSNVWAADVNCDGAINMADVMTLWYDYANYPTPGEHVVNCCGG